MTKPLKPEPEPESKPELRLWFINEYDKRGEILVRDIMEAEIYIKSINNGAIEEDPFTTWKDYGLDHLVNNIWMPYKIANLKLLEKLQNKLEREDK